MVNARLIVGIEDLLVTANRQLLAISWHQQTGGSRKLSVVAYWLQWQTGNRLLLVIHLHWRSIAQRRLTIGGSEPAVA